MEKLTKSDIAYIKKIIKQFNLATLSAIHTLNYLIETKCYPEDLEKNKGTKADLEKQNKQLVKLIKKFK